MDDHYGDLSSRSPVQSRNLQEHADSMYPIIHVSPLHRPVHQKLHPSHPDRVQLHVTVRPDEKRRRMISVKKPRMSGESELWGRRATRQREYIGT